jgi:hypothetical protein
MATYIDYGFYSGVYGGSAVASSGFKPLALRASAMLDLLTSGRVAPIIAAGTDADVIQKVRLAACAIIDELYRLDATGGIIASESVGSHSVSYAVTPGTTVTKRLTGVAVPFLADTGLLFRGFNASEYGSNIIP